MLTAASQVPLWAAIVIGLGGGVIGTLVAQWLQRGAEMRTRMLETADEFISAGIAAERAVREASLALPLVGGLTDPPTEELDDALARTKESSAEMSAMLPRIQLLFGDKSATKAEAVSASLAFIDLSNELGERKQRPWIAFSTLDASVRASQAIGNFSLAARRDVRFGFGSRWVLRLYMRGWRKRELERTRSPE
jgi:hypothetical protein